MTVEWFLLLAALGSGMTTVVIWLLHRSAQGGGR